MTFDQLKDKWQSDQPACKLNIESEMLFKEVQRNKQSFESAIFWRDFREVGIAFLLVIAFTYFGLDSGEWSLFLMAFMCLFVGGFFLVDRVIQRRKNPRYDDSLTGCIADSLAQINHQIWLLKNVFWWYLLPFLIGAAFITGSVGWMLRNNASQFWSHIFRSTATWAVLTLVIYKLNQYAVRKALVPRKDELGQLFEAVTDSEN